MHVVEISDKRVKPRRVLRKKTLGNLKFGKALYYEPEIIQGTVLGNCYSKQLNDLTDHLHDKYEESKIKLSANHYNCTKVISFFCKGATQLSSCVIIFNCKLHC